MSRARFRVGREVTYFPTDAEASAGGGSAGDAWFGRITKVNVDSTVNIAVAEADGGALAKMNISRTQRKGGFDFRQVGGSR